MKFLVLESTDPYLNLAIEEYFLTNTDLDVCMLWQNSPTVVIGKNQNVYAEVNRAFTNENKIKIARRITGGGAVYHDLGNINYSFVSAKGSENIDFARFTTPIIKALDSIGVSASLSGRNDITVDGRKISGSAQYSTRTRTLHHGTLLFDGNLEVLSSALNVDTEKIRAKAISSVRSRVANIKEFIKDSYTTGEFLCLLRDFFINEYHPETIEAPNNDIVNALYTRNSSDSWLFPQNAYLSNYSMLKKGRFNFGGIEIYLEMSGDIILSAKILGDFFENLPISELEDKLCGLDISRINEDCQIPDVQKYIYGMTKENLVNLLKK